MTAAVAMQFVACNESGGAKQLSSPAPPYQLCEARGLAPAIAENSLPRKFAERFLVYAMGIDVRIEGSAECALQDAQDGNKQN
jgi:hypothetical protein